MELRLAGWLLGLLLLRSGPGLAEEPSPAPVTPPGAQAAAALQPWELEAMQRLELLQNLELLEQLEVLEDLGVLEGTGGES